MYELDEPWGIGSLHEEDSKFDMVREREIGPEGAFRNVICHKDKKSCNTIIINAKIDIKISKNQYV